MEISKHLVDFVRVILYKGICGVFTGHGFERQVTTRMALSPEFRDFISLVTYGNPAVVYRVMFG